MNQAIASTEIVIEDQKAKLASAAGPTSALAALPVRAQGLLRRMFADPHLLEKEDRRDLIASLRECVAANPRVSDLRVMLGMALCVNYEVNDAITELEEGVRLAPDSFIAHLKLGELWMRLRVCTKAETHSRQAALLARNPFQSELARKQAATIRTLMHNGIQRGGHAYKSPWRLVTHLRKLWRRDQPKEVLAVVENS